MFLTINLKNFNDGLLGGSYICTGKASGEEFFEYILCPAIDRYIINDDEPLEFIVINGDGTYGIPNVFLRAVIELCIETYGVEFVEKYIVFLNQENPYQEKMRLENIKNTINFYKSKEKGFKHPDNLKYCKRYNLDKNTKTYE